MAVFGNSEEKERQMRDRNREEYVAEKNHQKRIGQTWENVQVSTGSINLPHDVLTIVFAKSVRQKIKSDDEALLETAGFENLLHELQKKALDAGGNGLIHCQFTEQFVDDRVYQLAYGTAVNIKITRF
ncbi:hypothetical protein MFLO_02728 [Listeria floridensis FSL S10-1187]|uniref:Uncharacterized protein n=1 Tax=Listeria floridensis FSL S10-1187 TaxID=1265817 RepID=A0ABP3B0M1_9LIST|nr:hypothetical protein [Listeria floridensis]EUJ33430.1 hypothetical protein MFLO_02728 [Listeria floridensis FSL S10-1187]